MKKLNYKFIVIAVLILLAAAGLLIVKPKTAHSPAADHPAGQQQKAIYYCPMHPGYTSDKPGDCPICNMRLVKKEMAEQKQIETANPLMPRPEFEMVQGTAATEMGNMNHAAPPKSLTASQMPQQYTVQELMQMKPEQICLIHKCKMGKCYMAMTEEFARLGKCPHCGEDLGVMIKQAMPQGYSAVKLTGENERAMGVQTQPVEKLPVSKNIETTGRIAYDPVLYQTEEEYLQAIQNMQKLGETGTLPELKDQAAKMVDAAKVKLRLLGLNDDMIREIEKSGKPDRSLLYSDPGGHVWLYAPVYEYELPLVKTGQTVLVEVPSLPGKKFEGTIRSIDSVLDPATRSARIRAVLDNSEGLLKPEMYVNASVKIDLGEKIVIPAEAVFQTGEKNIVFVDAGSGHFEPREISLGPELNDSYVVESGLTEGEEVVTSGNFLIDSESRLKAALEAMGSGGGGGMHEHGG